MKPTKEFREKNVKVAVFEKAVQGKTAPFVSKSLSLQIGYKDKEDKWKNIQISIIKRNLKKVISVLSQADDYLEEGEQASLSSSVKMKKGQMYKGDCKNCLDGVDLEFRYKEDSLFIFVCQYCGVYNHFEKEDLKNIKRL